MPTTGAAPDVERPSSRLLPLAVVLVVLARFPGLLWPLSSDEAGFLLVSRAWDPTPDSLYGTYWVDRAPILIGTIRLSDLAAGAYGARLLAAVFAALLVVAVHRLAALVAGPVAGRWATIMAVGLLANPYLNAWTGKGEVFGTALVALACWWAVAAVRRPPGLSRVALLLAAGAAGALAVGMKQSLVGGLVFAGVFWVGATFAGRVSVRECVGAALALLTGAAVPVVATVAWAVSHGIRLETLSYQVLGFRSDASAVIADGSMRMVLIRGALLLLVFVTAGMAPALVLLASSVRHLVPHHAPELTALGAMLAVDLVGVALGGSYWRAYLIPLVPGVALAVAFVALLPGWRRRATRLLTLSACALSVVLLVQWTATRTTGLLGPESHNIGTAIKEVAEPDDTVVTLYGMTALEEASGLRSPYEHLWSLPMRTLDPELTDLKALLAGPEAPTWVAELISANSWKIDESGELRGLLAERYVVAGEPCDSTIWRLADEPRPELPDVDCSAPWTLWTD
ncbi:hypothetical protein GCM10027026_28090 [Myroides odoratimimus subsp. xuanwuensis]